MGTGGNPWGEASLAVDELLAAVIRWEVVKPGAASSDVSADWPVSVLTGFGGGAGASPDGRL